MTQKFSYEAWKRSNERLISLKQRIQEMSKLYIIAHEKIKLIIRKCLIDHLYNPRPDCGSQIQSKTILDQLAEKQNDDYLSKIAPKVLTKYEKNFKILRLDDRNGQKQEKRTKAHEKKGPDQTLISLIQHQNKVNEKAKVSHLLAIRNRKVPTQVRMRQCKLGLNQRPSSQDHQFLGRVICPCCRPWCLETVQSITRSRYSSGSRLRKAL